MDHVLVYLSSALWVYMDEQRQSICPLSMLLEEIDKDPQFALLICGTGTISLYQCSAHKFP